MKDNEKVKKIEVSKKEKKPFASPTIETEKILDAGLGSVCNGMQGGSRKSTAGEGCSTLKT